MVLPRRHVGSRSRQRVTQRSSAHPSRLRLGPLVAVMFFTVSGGPFGLEGLVASVGPGVALLLLVATPLLYSVPETLLVGELASMLPAEGGYYQWVKRAFGRFWGFWNGWLSWTYSLLDMAIYPVLLIQYVGFFLPGLGWLERWLVRCHSSRWSTCSRSFPSWRSPTGRHGRTAPGRGLHAPSWAGGLACGWRWRACSPRLPSSTPCCSCTPGFRWCWRRTVSCPPRWRAPMRGARRRTPCSSRPWCTRLFHCCRSAACSRATCSCTRRRSGSSSRR